jgi:hypothetical protein
MKYVSLVFTLLCLRVEFITCNLLKLKGAVVGLLSGFRKELSEVIDRNKSLLRYLLSESWNSSLYEKPDVILFHEKSLGEDYIHQIITGSSDLEIKFVEVEFDGFAVLRHDNETAVLRDFCPLHQIVHSSIGYKNMCRFWFIGFIKYLEGYDWMLRIDTYINLRMLRSEQRVGKLVRAFMKEVDSTNCIYSSRW